MPEENAGQYTIRKFEIDDLPTASRWRNLPHVKKWWGDTTVEPELEKMNDSRIEMWILEQRGQPFGFIQDYQIHAWEKHHFAYLPLGARGIDLYIGELSMLKSGHGTEVLAMHTSNLFSAGVPAVGIDPHPANAAAIRSFEKAGFKPVSGPIPTVWGDAILMECWPNRE